MSILEDIMFRQGRSDAIELRNMAKDLTDTEIIAEETRIPNFNPEKDYSKWPVNSPILDEGQVWKLIQPYNAKEHPRRPSELRALWGLCHSKDPATAKPWVDPMGISGMYMKDECYKDGDIVYRCLNDNTVHDAKALPSAWKNLNEEPAEMEVSTVEKKVG